MKCLLFSDLHGNLHALEFLLKKEKEIDLFINLGDVVNYSPWGNECVELIESIKNCINIRGNHEDYFISGKCDVKNEIVKAFFHKNLQTFTQFETIKKYVESITFENFIITHNILEKGYIFNDTKIDINNNYIIGHSHQQFTRKINDFYIINPGSLGQNRRNINRCEYIIWDTQKKIFNKKYFDIDYKIVLKEMEVKKFPKICLNYIKSKI